jgi:hypothetical protein
MDLRTHRVTYTLIRITGGSFRSHRLALCREITAIGMGAYCAGEPRPFESPKR